MLKGRNAIMTGSNRGIGKAILEKYAENGANIWACCRKHNEDFEKHIRELSEKYRLWIKPVYFELGNEESMARGMQSILDEKLPIDILVNNAGINSIAMFYQTTIDEIRNVFEINLFSQLYITQKVIKRMIRAKRGAIINITSIRGFEPEVGRIAYSSSKAALIMSTRALAKELRQFNIRVNSIAPGHIDTDMTRPHFDDLLKMYNIKNYQEVVGTPEEIANMALFLASDLATFVNGQIIRVDGGL